MLYSFIDTEFHNKLNAELFKLMGVKHHVTTAYHPEANGLVEKQNSSTAQALKVCINEQSNWHECLHSIAVSFHGSQHASTTKSPFEMMYQHQMTFPMQLRTDLLCHKQQMKKQNPDAFPDEEDDGGLQPEVEILPDPSQEKLIAHLKQVQKVLHNVHEEASCKIIKAPTRYAKNYDLRHMVLKSQWDLK